MEREQVESEFNVSQSGVGTRNLFPNAPTSTVHDAPPAPGSLEWQRQELAKLRAGRKLIKLSGKKGRGRVKGGTK
jgi:hypothetical protein